MVGGVLNIKIKESRPQSRFKNCRKIIKATIENKINYLTLFAFSTENWKRPKKTK